jgi:bifunctional DNase/RNase
VVINDLQDSTFFATIEIETPGGTVPIDSRPSDAIALAARAMCPVYVDGDALKALVDMNREDGTQVRIVRSDETEDDESGVLLSEAGAESDNDLDPSKLPTAATNDDDEMERFRRLVGELDL